MQSMFGTTFHRRKPASAAHRPQQSTTVSASTTRTAATTSSQHAFASRNLSEYSTPAVPDSGWCAKNFMLGAGMVILQPSTQKIVVLYETRLKYWFFPKGRKDIGESLETTAIREAYEESGYQVTFLPLYTPTKAPAPPGNRGIIHERNTEPVFLTMMSWRARLPTATMPAKEGGEYLTSWYVGQIPENAVHNIGTGMPDEQNYTSHLLTYQEAMERLRGAEQFVLRYAWDVYIWSLQIDEKIEAEEQRAEEPGVTNGTPCT